MVVNDTRVLPARILGKKASGGNAEIFLLSYLSSNQEGQVWEALVKPSRRLKSGQIVNADGLGIRILSELPDGMRLIQILDSDRKNILSHGRVPLPPYIRNQTVDPERYQTVFAANEGAVAAPTAGLHFTPELLSTLAASGVEIIKITLHVGIGTFREVSAECIRDHRIHEEKFEITSAAAERINLARARKHRVIACGTTSCRALESAESGGLIRAGESSTGIFIYPGYKFRVIDGLITNFHLPRSTLLMLVSALTGRELVFKCYQEALRANYRFFSFGDAMLVI